MWSVDLTYVKPIQHSHGQSLIVYLPVSPKTESKNRSVYTKPDYQLDIDWLQRPKSSAWIAERFPLFTDATFARRGRTASLPSLSSGVFSGPILNCSSRIRFLGCQPHSDWVDEVESVDNHLMCTYVVNSLVRLPVGGQVIRVHFGSRENTPWNDGMEGGHISSFHFIEVAFCR